MNAPGSPDNPERPDDEETTRMTAADANATDRTTEFPHADGTTSPEFTYAGGATSPEFTHADGATSPEFTHADGTTTPDQPLEAPLPYGAGFATQHYGYGVAPEPVRYTPAVATQESGRERSGSPVLAAAGLLSMGVAVWAILGAPMITTTVMLAGALVIAVLVGLVMVVRR